MKKCLKYNFRLKRWLSEYTDNLRITYLAREQGILPRGFVVAEVIAAVAKSDELRGADVRHFGRVPVPFNAFA